jgi:hypothetical protein
VAVCPADTLAVRELPDGADQARPCCTLMVIVPALLTPPAFDAVKVKLSEPA